MLGHLEAPGFYDTLVMETAPQQSYLVATEQIRRGLAGDFRRELEPDFGPLDPACCPRCRSDRFQSRRPMAMLGMLAVSYFLFGLIFPVTASIHQCRVCGTRWSDDAA